MADEPNVELTNLAKQRVAHAAAVAELQYQHAVELCKRYSAMAGSSNDPLLAGFLQAISTNYAALVTRPKA